MPQQARPHKFLFLSVNGAPTSLTVLLLATLKRAVRVGVDETSCLGRCATQASLSDQIINSSVLRLTDDRPEAFLGVICFIAGSRT